MNAPEGAASPVGDARAVLTRGTQLRQSIRDLDTGPAVLRDEVKRAFDALRDEMVRRDVAGIPIARLKDTTSGRLRLGALERAGYGTVGAVLRATPAMLERIDGVGATTANQVIAAARQVCEAVQADLQFRVDLDPSNKLSTQLIGALYRADSFASITEATKQAAAQALPDLEAALAAAAPTGSRLRMFFRGRQGRADARAALARVHQLRDWSETSGFGVELGRAGQLAGGATNVDAVAWKDFERRSVSYYGRLGEVVDLGLDVAAAEGFLPKEIIERVQQQKLDDTFRRVSLRGYQSFGARFALVQRRVIIGDEMGLGKTIEAIAAMAHLRALDRTHFLVACPASVLVNWTREIATHSTLHAYRLHGFERDQNLKRWLREGGVGVTTIDSLHHIAVPADLEVAMLVVDEAHYVKNPDARRSRSVRLWTERVDRVLFLTGTPMENRVEEFRNLVDYVQPQLAPDVHARHGVAGAKAFRKAVAPVYLRRNQEDVLQELPDLARIDEWVDFTSQDAAAYRAAVAAGNFMAMRRAAYATASPSQSAKLARLVELVIECAANGRKVVIFSFFRDVLDLVVGTLGSIVFGPLSGSTPPTERQALVDRFAAVDGHAVLVSQIQAGGVGLNMQAASVAILCEPQLKPTTEDQAVARLHRMGQVHPVQAHRLLTTNSADERLLEILATKSRLFDEYARRSDIAEASPDAVDISDVGLSRKIVEIEQERMATEAMGEGASSDQHR